MFTPDDREYPTFANINLLGVCNANCYFCLGGDISEHLNKHNQLLVPAEELPNLPQFLDDCRAAKIDKLYITGQNTDPTMYSYLPELIGLLHGNGFKVGIRTNGYRAPRMLPLFNTCELSIGYSIHTLSSRVNDLIIGRVDLPDWDTILTHTRNCRVAIVVGRWNAGEFFDIVARLSRYPNVRYIQARRISTLTRKEEFSVDQRVYEELARYVAESGRFESLPGFHAAERYIIYGKEVCFWRTVETTIGSWNYFSDGTISKDYHIVKGYLAEHKETA